MRTLIQVGGALVLAAAAGFFLVPGSTFHGKGPGAKGQGRSGAAIYDTATETSISGTLAQPPARGRMGMYLSVEESSGAMVDVRLAPNRYLAAQGFSIQQGEQLEVTGSEVRLGGAPVLLAREVTKQGRTVELRDRAGRPLWR